MTVPVLIAATCTLVVSVTMRTAVVTVMGSRARTTTSTVRVAIIALIIMMIVILAITISVIFIIVHGGISFVVIVMTIIVSVEVVSHVGVVVVSVVCVIEVIVVIVLTAFTSPPLITDAVSTLVQACVFDALNTAICSGSSATITAGIAPVVALSFATSGEVHASIAIPEVVAFTTTIQVVRSIGDAVFTVVFGWAGTPITEIVTFAAPDVASWSGEALITDTVAIVPVCVPSTRITLARRRAPTPITRKVTSALPVSHDA
jgi:hypothetical protein